MAEKHIYTINLSKAKAVSRQRRAGRAMRMVKDYVQKHADATAVSVSNALNEHLWDRGAQSPPSSVEVQVVEDNNVAHVELADRDFELPAEEPDETEEAPVQEDYEDEEIAEMNVDEVKELVDESTVSAQRALDIEYAGKNRSTLIDWLEERTGEADVEDADAGEDDEATYDLPDDVIETFESGSIDDGKDAARELGKSEFEKLLNFEEAHQNRKGMKQFLRSNMN